MIKPKVKDNAVIGPTMTQKLMNEAKEFMESGIEQQN
jgi:hypothetical protein